MSGSKRLAAPVLLAAGFAAALATPIHAQGSASALHAKTDRVVVKITDTGTLWGIVKATYKAHGKSVTKTCSKATCSWKIPAGTKIKLSETPTNSQTWPFKDWKIAKKGSHAKTVTKTSTTFKVKGNYAVNVVYVVA